MIRKEKMEKQAKQILARIEEEDDKSPRRVWIARDYVTDVISYLRIDSLSQAKLRLKALKEFEKEKETT